MDINQLISAYTNAETALLKAFDFEQDWRVLPIDDMRKYVWILRVQPAAKSGGHELGCRWAKALGSVAVECEHGVDVCPKCDPCECEVTQ